MMDIPGESKRAIHAYKAEKYDEALHLALALSKQNDRMGHLLTGLIFEMGLSGQGVQLDRAYRSFECVAKGFDDDEGFLGCARISMLRNDGEDHAIELVKKAIARGNKFAPLMLGDIYARQVNPLLLTQARRLYIQSALRGAAWGWRRWADVEKTMGNSGRWLLLHLVATILFPLYRLAGGRDSLRES